jgi:hypothetical protein
MAKFLLLVIAAALGYVIVRQALPDIQRYIRIETM